MLWSWKQRRGLRSDWVGKDSGSRDTDGEMRAVAKVDDEEEGPSYQGKGESYEPSCEAPSSRRAMMGGQSWASRRCSGEVVLRVSRGLTPLPSDSSIMPSYQQPS